MILVRRVLCFDTPSCHFGESVTLAQRAGPSWVIKFFFTVHVLLFRVIASNGVGKYLKYVRSFQAICP